MYNKNKKQPRTVEYHKILRKAVAGMTSEAWHLAPHAGGNYEPDVTEFWDTYLALRKSDPQWADITANSLLLYVITQGLVACPRMNGHLHFNLTGRVELYDNIDITMPMVLPEGGMMTFKIQGCERHSLGQLQEAVDDMRRRLNNSCLEKVMVLPALDDTVHRLLHGQPVTAVARAYHSMFGPCRIPWKTVFKKETHAEQDRLSRQDLEQGTVMVTNFGSVYKGAYAPPAMLTLIPPLICVVGIGGLVERPGVATTPDGVKVTAPRKYIPFQIIFDHRAINYADIVPFMQRLDEIFARSEDLAGWI